VSVRIRLTRAGRKKIPHYRIVVMDSRNRRDGAYLEQIGVYNPLQKPAHIELSDDKALSWLAKGAIPSETVRSLFAHRGIMLQHHLTLKNASPEKIATELDKWKENAAARAARRAEAKHHKKAKKDAESAPVSSV
jgi:small subunit ribosomal protein S16